MARTVKCVKLGREAEGMDFPPYPGALGKRIWENVSKEAWAQWLKQQTMLVNENRLNLADARARKYLMEQTERHFFGQGADTASGYVPPLIDYIRIPAKSPHFDRDWRPHGYIEDAAKLAAGWCERNAIAGMELEI